MRESYINLLILVNLSFFFWGNDISTRLLFENVGIFYFCFITFSCYFIFIWHISLRVNAGVVPKTQKKKYYSLKQNDTFNQFNVYLFIRPFDRLCWSSLKSIFMSKKSRLLLDCVILFKIPMRIEFMWTILKSDSFY